MGQPSGRSIRTPRPAAFFGAIVAQRLPEYALGIALVCVVSLGAISFLTDSSGG